MNNPVRFIDPDGQKIYIYYRDDNGDEQKYTFDPNVKYEGDNQFIKDFYEAYEYLNENEVADIINSFIDDEMNSINIIESSKNTIFKSNGKHRLNQNNEQIVGTILWNPTQGVKFKDDYGDEGRLSPSVGLLHEFGHGYGIKEEGIGSFTIRAKYKRNMGDYHNAEEEHVITKFENPAAKKLGQGVRPHHNGKAITTIGVNSTMTQKEHNKRKK